MPKPLAQTEEGTSQRVAFGTAVAGYNEDLYELDGPLKLRPGYVTSIDSNVVNEENRKGDINKNYRLDEALFQARKNSLTNVTAPKHFITEAENATTALQSEDPFKRFTPNTVADSDNSYLAKARKSDLYSRDEIKWDNGKSAERKDTTSQPDIKSEVNDSSTANSKGRPTSKRR